MLPPLCDGVTLVFKNADGNTQSKSFSIVDVHTTLPDELCAYPYLDRDCDEEPVTALGGIIQEYDAGTSLSVAWSAIDDMDFNPFLHKDPFRDWKLGEDIASYGTWLYTSEMLVHLKYLATNGVASTVPPTRPLVVTFVAAEMC